MALINELSYIDSPDPAQDGSIIYHSNPATPPSDGGYKETMTEESMDRWARSVTAKYVEGGSDSVRPSPPSSSNGDDMNPSRTPEEDCLELISISTDNIEISIDDPHTTSNDMEV